MPASAASAELMLSSSEIPTSVSGVRGTGAAGVVGGVWPVWGMASVVVLCTVPLQSRGVWGLVSAVESEDEDADKDDGGPFGVGGMISMKFLAPAAVLLAVPTCCEDPSAVVGHG